MANRQAAHDARMYLGIEGGGTHTVAILADDLGKVLSRRESGPMNLRFLDDDSLRLRFQQMASECRQMPAAICVGLAALRTKEDHARVGKAIRAAWPGIPCSTCSDLETGLAAAGPWPGKEIAARVLVLSGTGSCCFGKTAQGRSAKVGGWGHLLGDKGSGYEIGLRALKACVYYFDRDGVWPRLGSDLLQHLHLNGPDDLVPWVQTAAKFEVAELAQVVFTASRRRDKIAVDILTGASESLAKDAAACAKRLVSPKAEVEFILAGGCLTRQPAFSASVKAKLKLRWPRARVVTLTREGAWGAASIAHRQFLTETIRVSTEPGAPAKPPVAFPSRPRHQAAEPAPNLPEARALSPTERRNPRSMRLDKMALRDAIKLMLAEEARVPGVLAKHAPSIERVIRAIVRSFKNGGRLFYVGAGTSGRLGTLDASECPPTFRVPAAQVQGIMAGGSQALWQSIEGAEDDTEAGADAVRFRGVDRNDIVIGIAASGRTPFVWGALGAARRQRATTCLVAFNPYLRFSRNLRPDEIIAVDLGPEVLTGSTRLKAGTATKLLLNMFTTLAMVRLGKVMSNLMVDVNPSNVKLRDRAVRILGELTGASRDAAQAALEKSGWVVKAALGEIRRGLRKPRREPALTKAN